MLQKTYTLEISADALKVQAEKQQIILSTFNTRKQMWTALNEVIYYILG